MQNKKAFSWYLRNKLKSAKVVERVDTLEINGFEPLARIYSKPLCHTGGRGWGPPCAAAFDGRGQ